MISISVSANAVQGSEASDGTFTRLDWNALIRYGRRIPIHFEWGVVILCRTELWLRSVRQKVDVTPFKVNGDPSTLTDQRIPTRSCERSLTLTGILITYTCILTHLHRVYTHRVHNHPHLSQPLHIPHSPFTRCLVSHFNGCTT